MSQKQVKKLYPKLYGKIRQDMVNQIYNKGAETKGIKGAENIPSNLLTGMYDEIHKNMKKTGDIKKKYGGSMKKMNTGSKVGTTKKSYGGTIKKKYGGTIKKMKSGSKVGMTQQQMMACGGKG